MKDRLVLIREKAGLSQSKFAEKINAITIAIIIVYAIIPFDFFNLLLVSANIYSVSTTPTYGRLRYS